MRYISPCRWPLVLFRRKSAGGSRRYQPAFAVRDYPLDAASSDLPDKLLGPLPRFAYEPLRIHHGIGLISKKNQIKLDWTAGGLDKSEMRQEINALCDSKITATDVIRPASITGKSSQCDGAICKEGNWGGSPMDLAEPLGINHAMKNLVEFDPAIANILKMVKLTNDVYEEKIITEDVCSANGTHGIWNALILEGSSHHDGAIYKKKWGYWRPGSRFDFADRTETVLDLKKFSEVSPCFPDQECCLEHPASKMIQIFSLRLAKTPISSGLMLLYGYLAARDCVDGKLNYIFNRSRDNPVIIQQGHLIEMTGPRRGIVMITNVLMEFDMRIKIGEREEDDLQLIDGLTWLTERFPMEPSTLRFNGSCGGAVDMRLAPIEQGMEALIEVIISEVQSPFSLSLVSTTDELEEIQLFHGAIAELGTKRFVVAVQDDTIMHLKFKVGKKGSEDDVEHCYSFNSNEHGCVSQQLKLEVACILVKVTVSPPIP